MSRLRVADMGMPCQLCALRGGPYGPAVRVTASRRWYGDTDGEYTPADPVDGVPCCTTCYQRVYRRARRKVAGK